MLNLLKKLFSPDKPPTFSLHKIEYHRRYQGTYMLFGFHAVKRKWFLLIETLMPTTAQEWSEEYSIPMPNSATECTCCKGEVEP